MASTNTAPVYTIYALANPLYPLIPYVGLTNNLERRYKEHLMTSSKQPAGRWIQELLDLGVHPLLIVLDTGIPNLKLAERYETYWIAHLSSGHHILQNISKNPQTDEQKESQEIDWHHHRDLIVQLPDEEWMRLLETNSIGLRRYTTRYCRAFTALYFLHESELYFDQDKHRAKVAEVALTLCSIPTIDDDDEEMQRMGVEIKALCIERGITFQAALDILMYGEEVAS